MSRYLVLLALCMLELVLSSDSGLEHAAATASHSMVRGRRRRVRVAVRKLVQRALLISSVSMTEIQR